LSKSNLQGRKPRNRQDIRAERQRVSAVLTCAVPELGVFHSLVFSISQPWVCAHLLGSTARIQRDIRADCFCSCEVHCCRADQNRRQKVFNRGDLRLFRGGLILKIW